MSLAKAALLALLSPKQQEQTMTGNVGGFAVPFGPPLRQVFPTTASPERRGKRLELPVLGVGSVEVFEVPDEEELVKRAEEQLARFRRR